MCSCHGTTYVIYNLSVYIALFLRAIRKQHISALGTPLRYLDTDGVIVKVADVDMDGAALNVMVVVVVGLAQTNAQGDAGSIAQSDSIVTKAAIET